MDKVESRRQEIIKLLEQAPMIQVGQMAKALEVTTETIRKDLSELEAQGLVVRIRGGAALVDRGTSIPYALREVLNKEDKQRIAKIACSRIEADSTILMEGSTTTMALGQELLAVPELLKTLTIVTNSLYIAELFEFGTICKKLFVLGGWIEPSERVSQWAFLPKALEHLHVDMAILSGAAMSQKFRVSSYYEHDMLFQQAAMDAADRTMLLLDKGKYPASAVYKVCDLEAMDLLVTNIDFSKHDLKELTAQKVEVLVADE